MAQADKRRVENVPGNFFVDETCIDCDACRWIAPEVFERAGEKSAVFHQPQNAGQTLKALQAVIACPTASIGVVEKNPDIQKVAASFPLLIDQNVYYCGYHSEKSFGAASYFIKRKEGNILIDSPRFSLLLAKRLEEMGGVRYLYLTHCDDVADHEEFHKHFGCERILHENDVTARTREVEIKIKGTEPYELAKDLLIIPVPGHTQGHTVLLYQNTFLFTGDHLAYDDEDRQLYAFRDACWYSWAELVRSMKKLADYSFEWILPGHGRRFHASRNQMKNEMQKCLKRL